ncbi:MAG TPA: hypothetical protein VFI03_12180 [Solirubrobacterales bacterium]|nr:hypothetical protein [Solirubrobacterales bacterium]
MANCYSRRGGTAILVVVLVSIFSVSSASASLLKEAGDAVKEVGDTVKETGDAVKEAADGAVGALPKEQPATDPPSALPPVKAPALPETPTQEPKSKTPAPPKSKTPSTSGGRSETSGAAHGPVVDSVSDGANQLGGGVTNTGTNAATDAPPRVDVSGSDGPGASPAGQGAPDPGTSSAPGEPSVDPAEAAPEQGWLAYVWPAVALAAAKEALADLLARPMDAISRPISSESGLLSVLGAVAGSSGASGLSGQAATLSASRDSALRAFAPHGGGMSLLATTITVLGALIGVVALTKLTVGEDFFRRRWLH